MFPGGPATRTSPSGHATSGDGEHDEYGEHEDNEAPGLRLTVRATHRGHDSSWLPRVDGLKSDGWQRMAQTESRFRAARRPAARLDSGPGAADHSDLSRAGVPSQMCSGSAPTHD